MKLLSVKFVLFIRLQRILPGWPQPKGVGFPVYGETKGWLCGLAHKLRGAIQTLVLTHKLHRLTFKRFDRTVLNF